MSEVFFQRFAPWMLYSAVVLLAAFTAYICGFVAYVGFRFGSPWDTMLFDVPAAAISGIVQLSIFSLARSLRRGPTATTR